MPITYQKNYRAKAKIGVGSGWEAVGKKVIDSSLLSLGVRYSGKGKKEWVRSKRY
jgi:hypothetical protein